MTGQVEGLAEIGLISSVSSNVSAIAGRFADVHITIFDPPDFSSAITFNIISFRRPKESPTATFRLLSRERKSTASNHAGIMAFLPIFLSSALLSALSISNLGLISSMVGFLHKQKDDIGTYQINWPGNTVQLVVEPQHLWVDQGHTSNGVAGYGFFLGLFGLYVAWRQRKRQGRVCLLVLRGGFLSDLLAGSFEDAARALHPPAPSCALHIIRPHLRFRRHQPNQRAAHLRVHRTIEYRLPCRQVDTRNLVHSRAGTSHG